MAPPESGLDRMKRRKARRGKLAEGTCHIAEFSLCSLHVFRLAGHAQADVRGEQQAAELIGSGLDILFAIVLPAGSRREAERGRFRMPFPPSQTPRQQSKRKVRRQNPVGIDVGEQMMMTEK